MKQQNNFVQPIPEKYRGKFFKQKIYFAPVIP